MDLCFTVKSMASVVLLQLFVALVEGSFDPFMDSKFFVIKWQGPLDLNREEIDILGDRHVMITTNHQEKYRCILPETLKVLENEISSYSGPSAEELLQSLFKQTHCSYRIESYWTYELCHGKHLKQYHETKEQGMEPKLQEYYLGFGNHHDKEKDTEKESSQSESNFRVIDGVELPFYEVIMGDGSTCDLTQKPRKTHVLYVCQQEGWGEIYELKESSTCEYEVIIMTSYLCSHPKYRPKTTPVNEVRCHAMYGSPMKPLELSQTEIETRYLQDPSLNYVKEDASVTIQGLKKKPKFFRAPTGIEDGIQTKVQSESKIESETKVEGEVKTHREDRGQQIREFNIGAVTDKQTLRDFLSGLHCLTGGTGWWRHELCFGNFVKQFHGSRNKGINIHLGYWNKENHIIWLRDNPLKRPRPTESRKSISLYYSEGDVCDITGKQRSCEVKLKCLENPKNPHAIVLSLAEPESCQYILTVESALFCPILTKADDDGLFTELEF